VDLEKEIIRKAKEGGVRVIGPNCMGLYSPDVGLTFRHSLPKEPGHIALASQSGGNAADLEYQGAGRGLRFSKIISFGNAADLNESDFLDYLIQDPQTEIIAMYLEGIKDSGRFLDLLRAVQGTKPVVLLKAGRTNAGSRAVVTHTASLSGDDVLWDAICKQFGVIRVHSVVEMADLLLAFQLLKPCAGNSVLIMGGGGGGSVSAADVCELEGFEVPPLPPSMMEELQTLAPQVWSLVSNPMDGSVMGGVETLVRCFQLGARWEGVDLLIGNSSAIWLMDDPDMAKRHSAGVDFLIHLAKEATKPMVIFVDAGDPTTPWRVDGVLEAQEKCRDAGIPVYPNIHRAARALAHFTGYHRRVG
jgi:acyl-CoA synthetase (NDP forming)